MHQVVYVLSGDNMFMNGVNSRLESVMALFFKCGDRKYEKDTVISVPIIHFVRMW